MTIAVRDSPNGFALVGFDAIADCLQPEAQDCLWRVPVIDGMLAPHDDAYTIDDAYAYADASQISPISWRDLRRWASRFFQIYDCEFLADEERGCDLKICCIDSTQWEISTQYESIADRLRQMFKDTEDVRFG